MKKLEQSIVKQLIIDIILVVEKRKETKKTEKVIPIIEKLEENKKIAKVVLIIKRLKEIKRIEEIILLVKRPVFSLLLVS